MTIIAAAQWGGATFIGCDSAGTDGWSHQRDYGMKLRQYAFGWVGFTGSYRVIQAIGYELKKVEAVTADNYLELVAAVEAGLVSAGWARRSESGLPECKGLALLVATPSGLFTIHEDLSTLALRDFAAVGSGYQVAEGALHLASELARESAANQAKPRPSAADAVQRALSSAAALISTCGGELHVREVL